MTLSGILLLLASELYIGYIDYELYRLYGIYIYLAMWNPIARNNKFSKSTREISKIALKTIKVVKNRKIIIYDMLVKQNFCCKFFYKINVLALRKMLIYTEKVTDWNPTIWTWRSLSIAGWSDQIDLCMSKFIRFFLISWSCPHHSPY